MSRRQTLLHNLLRRRPADRELTEASESFAVEVNRRPGAGLESYARDLRYAVRMLRKSRALALACILTFAIGVGANVVVFSMVNALMFRTLPVAHPDQLQMLSLTVHGEVSTAPLTREDLRELAAQPHSAFAAVTSATLVGQNGVGVSVRGRARIASAGFVGGNYFAVMGLRPALGHFFDRDNAPEVVLSYGYWQSRFAGNRAVVGQPAEVDGRAVTIVAVAPRNFHDITLLLDTNVYLPVGMAPHGTANRPTVYPIPIVRLRSGATKAAAQAELSVFAQRLAVEHPENDNGLAIRMWPMSTGVMSIQGGSNPFGAVAALFQVLSGLVLLLAAANIMGVLLARARTRQREMAVRAALGAGRGRLVRQVFLETLVLAALGAALGMLLGLVASKMLSGLPPHTASLPLVLDFGFDWRVFGFGCLMALIMALVAGIVPAWRAASADPNQSLRGPEVGAGGCRRQRLHPTLVVAQVAGSLTLLIVGGLFVRSLVHVGNRPLGFEPAHVWNFVLDASGANYTPEQGRQVFDRLLPAVRALPGVRSASLARLYPLGTVRANGSVHPLTGKTRRAGSILNAVSPEYFSTMGIPVIAGRGITASDTAASTPVAVINAKLAHKLWPGESALGRQLALFRAARPITVVGVVGNSIIRFGGPIPYEVYSAISQSYTPRQVLQVRTAPNVATPVPAVERLLQQVAPGVPLGGVQSMTAAIHGFFGLFVYSLGARLALALGLVGLFLALIGVYGVVAYAAAQRTHEIGIRVALGARPRQVAAEILRSGGVVIASGIAIGLLAAVAISKLAGSFLVGVSGLDPMTFIAAALLLAVAAAASALVPAWRASRADPLAFLRCD
ncbi:MAG: ADOP family duplicated permease [Terriglobales bacterium]